MSFLRDGVRPAHESRSFGAGTSRPFGTEMTDQDLLNQPGARWHRDLALVLRRYGFWGLDVDTGSGSISPQSIRVINPAWDDPEPPGQAFHAYFLDRAGGADLPGLDSRREPPGRLLYSGRTSFFSRRNPVYHPLLEHISFAGDTVEPIWQTSDGRTVLGWWTGGRQRCLLVGLNVTEELVRYTQGNPARAGFAGNRNLWGLGHEQPAFLYDGHLVAGHELVPWADRLGQTLAYLLARSSGLPLVSPLPRGAKGAVMVTGDDDEAWLEKYAEQLAVLGDFPITYMLLPHTNHSRRTLADLPPQVELGVHVDALEDPESYDEICARQTHAVRQLVGDRPVRSIRNHGHLNKDYWGHLAAWEKAGLTFSLNIRALDGTCPTGSYLPFRVRRLDGSWSSHFSLFSTFSDNMLFQQKWTERKQIRCISAAADQIEKAHPGILVFNFHPQNVTGMRRVHKAVMRIGRRPGWLALGAESFSRWLETIDSARLQQRAGELVLTATRSVKDLAVSWPSLGVSQILGPFEGEQALGRTRL